MRCREHFLWIEDTWRIYLEELDCSILDLELPNCKFFGAEVKDSQNLRGGIPKADLQCSIFL